MSMFHAALCAIPHKNFDTILEIVVAVVITCDSLAYTAFPDSNALCVGQQTTMLFLEKLPSLSSEKILRSSRTNFVQESSLWSCPPPHP